MRFLIFLLLFVSAMVAQEEDKRTNPFAGSTEAAEAGRKAFSGSCSGCHGIHGEGGRGPNLRDRRMSDLRLFDTVRKGVKGADMPPSNLPDDEIWRLVTFVQALGAPAAEMPPAGNVERGRELFNGSARCSECHMIGGRGGFLGPDLTNIGGSRPLGLIRESVLDPSARWPEGYRGVTVHLRDGRSITGSCRDNTNYWILVLDAKGQLHSLPKAQVREVVFHKKSLMPGDYKERLIGDDLLDLLAFLSRQSVRPPEPPKKAPVKKED